MTVELVLLTRVAFRGQEVAGPRLRNLLALLAADLRAGRGATRLVEGVWPEKRPEHPLKALQVLVSRARAQLGADVIASTALGYRLTLGEEQVDAAAVLARLAASKRANDPAEALAQAEAGLAYWNGEPEAQADDPLGELRTARAATYRLLKRAHALALARLGRHSEALEPLIDALQPRDEEVLAEVLRCEAATLGPAAALARYEAYRRTLRDELGSDPGAGLQAVFQELLHRRVRRGVRHEPNPLLGRDDDIAAVEKLLHTSRVTTIVGPGGLGKTRLAEVVSRQAAQRTVQFVGLTGVGADGDIAAEVAAASGVGKEGSTLSGPAGIVAALGPDALLVLDNCEHVVEATAELAGTLVATSADLRILATSRAPLGLSSESVYPLPELTLDTCVELFRQRARAARPGVDLPPPLVARVCGHLDGLPLAVELAAARVRVLSVAEIARRLDDRLALLRGGSRDAPARHRTLHAVIDWSWHLLDPDAQAAMRALSVFTGGFTADAAGDLLGLADPVPVLEQLVDQSLLKFSDVRFRMLETVRDFSAAQRRPEDAVTERFLAWARGFGAAHHQAVFGADLVASVELIRSEHDNLLHALQLALKLDDASTAAAITAVLAGLWTIESDFMRLSSLGREVAWLLSHHRPEPDAVAVTRTAVVSILINAMLIRGPGAGRAMVALRRLPPADPVTLSGAAEAVLRAPDQAAIEAFCDSDRPMLSGVANGVMSYARAAEDDLEGALQAAERLLAAVHSSENRWLIAVANSRVAELHLEMDRADGARKHMLAVLPVLEELGAWRSVVRGRWALVLANVQCGDLDQAEEELERARAAGADDVTAVLGFDQAIQAEIQLARGELDAGLAAWRQLTERLRTARDREVFGMERWTWEAHVVTVVAHAHAGRLRLVEPLVTGLPELLDRVEGVTFRGAVLLALGLVELDRGDSAAGARMIALAERLRYLRTFKPTMSVEQAQKAAIRANRPAYEAAVASYAGLSREELLALEQSARPQVAE